MNLSYIHYGKGEKLVFLHGYLENKFLWKDFILNFPSFHSFCFDLPGCGESLPIENQTIDSMADAIKEMLDKLEIQKCIIIAHSMGGYVALSLSERYAEYIKGLVLLHSHPFADSEEKRKNREQEIQLIKEGKKSLLVQSFIRKLYAPNFSDNNALTLSRNMAEYTCPQGMIACLRAMATRPDRTHVLHNATFPVLWIYGKHDQLFTAELADNFKTNNQRVIKLSLEQAGHMGMFEATDEVVKAIKNFIMLCQ